MRDVRHVLPGTSVNKWWPDSENSNHCRPRSPQSIDFSGATPTTGFTLRFLLQVVSNSFFYTTPVKKWVEGFGFHAWELESDPDPSTACSHPPFLLLHQNKPSITSRWSFLGSMGKKLKLGICWAIASRVERVLTATVGFISSGLSYLSDFLLGSMARNKSRRWFIILRMVPKLCLVKCPLGVSLTSADELRGDDELFRGSRLMMWSPPWVKEVKLWPDHQLRRAGICAPSLQAGARLEPAQWLGTPPLFKGFLTKPVGSCLGLLCN